MIWLTKKCQKKLKNKEKLTILVAHDISPADALHFKNHKYAAFITDGGGVTSHTAILSRSLNIPSIVALQNARALIRDNDLIIVDGTEGVVIVNPTQEIQTHYKKIQNSWDSEQEKLQRIKTKKSINHHEWSNRIRILCGCIIGIRRKKGVHIPCRKLQLYFRHQRRK